MPEGLGYGIGRGLEQIGESLNRRFQGQAADREKQADAYELQAKDIAANIAKIGGKDKPEAAPLIQQLQAVVTKHNALYPPHETPALLARIQKFIGKTPGAAKPDPRAGMTAEGSIAQAPVQPNAILDDMTNFISAAQSANPTMTREQAQQEWWKQMQVKGGTVAKAGAAKPVWKQYKSPDGTVEWFDINEPETIPQGATAVVSGAQGPKAGTLGGFIAAKYPQGATPEQQLAAKTEWAASVPKTHVKVGSLEDYIAKKYPNASPEDIIKAREEFAAATTSTTTGTHEIIHDNGDGTATVYEVSTTTSKTFPGQAAPAGKSATPAPKATSGDLKDKAGALKPGQTISGKRTAADTDADKKYGDALRVSNFADEAMKEKSAAKDKLLAGQLIKASEGRFNVSQYDNLVKKAGLANTFQQWMESVQSGRLTDEVRNQLVSAAHSLRDAADKARKTPASAATSNADADQDFINSLGKK